MHRALISLALVTCGAVAAPTSHADGILDYLRNYDLNDYALGVAVTSGASPYAGASTSAFAYPYLTTFRDSSFTRDWLLVREGELGVRWVSESEWEFALSGRVQTRGTGAEPGAELLGIDSRKWALELGPSVTWRGWPVHVRLGVHDEITGHHGGYVSELALSVPLEWDRGFLVPTVSAVMESDDYTRYYFDVSPDEAAGRRDAYTADGARNTHVRVRWGYALSDRWLLSGNLGVEFLDDTISDSPIVDEDTPWSAAVGLAWNADLFRPRARGGDALSARDVELTLGFFNASIDSEFVHRSGDGQPGSRIDLEDALGISDSESVLRADLLWRIGHYHRLEAGYYRWSRAGLFTIDNAVQYGDAEFPAGSTLASKSETSVTRFVYGYSLIRDAQKEIGVSAGVHYSRVDLDVALEDGSLGESGGADKPLPVLGAFGSVPLGDKTTVGARASFFALEFDRYDGSLIVFSAEIRRAFGERFDAGLAWHFSRMDLDTSNDRLRGSLQLAHSGPAVFVSAGF